MAQRIGITIRSLRQMRGMTQKQLAEASGLTRSSITNIEMGNQTLTEDTLQRIAAALGYTVHVTFRLIR